jgi:hypothetical protein
VTDLRADAVGASKSGGPADTTKRAEARERRVVELNESMPLSWAQMQALEEENDALVAELDRLREDSARLESFGRGWMESQEKWKALAEQIAGERDEARAELERVTRERDKAVGAKERWADLAYTGKDELLDALAELVAVRERAERAEEEARSAKNAESRGALQLVREFHETFGLPVGSRPALPDAAERDLRWKLLHEEASEYFAAEGTDDLVEVADALGDMVCVIYGTALSYGIDLDAVVAEIHRSNMTKTRDESVKYPAKNVRKMAGYTPPDIAAVLAHLDGVECATDAVLEEGQQPASKTCDQLMRGMYGAVTKCARPKGHVGKHNSIWNHTDWPQAGGAAAPVEEGQP